MRILLPGLLLALFGEAAALSAQGYDVNCPTGLNRNFMHYQPVPYAGHEWSSQWMAKSSVRPLPSRSWYRAYPNRDITSIDGAARWTGAEILVHCWVYRSMYLTVIHYDPVGFAGYVRPTQQACLGGGEPMTSISPPGPWGSPTRTENVSEDTYDPYSPDAQSDCDDPEAGGGGTGGSDGSEPTFAEVCSSLGGKLHYDYVCLEQWNKYTGEYEVVWCGTAAICET